jgi:hypothetical protein
MNTVKKQHFVPRFYLQQFVNKSNRIHVYDKFRQASYCSNIEDVGTHNYFYNLSLETVAKHRALIEEKLRDENFSKQAKDEIIAQVSDVQMVEKYLSKLEDRFARILKDVLAGLEQRGRFKREHRHDIALMVALQFLRTKKRREGMIELERKMEEKVMEIVGRMNEVNGTNFTASDLGVEFDINEATTRHNMFLFDAEYLEEIATIFNKHIWSIGVNWTNYPLYTSDNPVATKAHKTDDWRSNTGIASPGIEIAFPLNSKFVIMMCDRNYFHDFEYRDNKLSNLTKDNVVHYNSLQVLSSYRHVYSRDNDFSLVEKMCQDMPDLTAPQEQWE